MRDSLEEYFTCANSAQGFVNYFPSTLEEMERIFILKGGPGTGKSTLMRKIGEHFRNAGQRTEYIHCSSDAKSLDGVVLRDKKIAVVDGTAPHVIEPRVPGAVEEYVNLGVAWEHEKLYPYKEEILRLQGQIKERYDQIYSLFREAKEIHDRWEKIYLDNVDFKALDAIAQDLTASILNGIKPKSKAGAKTHRFFGAMTPEGSVHYIEGLTADCQVRYFIKGRPGTGKSTLMRKLASAAVQLGLDAEIYHCSFDVKSLDMVVLRELKVCVFDATAPHELFPARDTDVILDLYETAVTPETDEKNQEQLEEISQEYETRMAKARALLGEIQEIHDAMEKIYIHAVDFTVTDQICEDLIAEIE